MRASFLIPPYLLHNIPIVLVGLKHKSLEILDSPYFFLAFWSKAHQKETTMTNSTKDSLWASFVTILACFSIIALSTDSDSSWRNHNYSRQQEEAIVRSIDVSTNQAPFARKTTEVTTEAPVDFQTKG